MPDSRLHPFWRLVLCAVVLLTAVSAVQSVGIGLLLAFSQQLGFGKLALDQRLVKTTMEISAKYALHLTVLSYPIGVGVLYLFRTKIDKYSWRSLGFSRVRALPDIVRGALTALLTLSVLYALMYVAGVVRFGGWSSDVQTHSGFYAVGSLLLFAVGFGSVGLFEELLFRGYGLANLRQFTGWGWAVAIQAAVFAVIHLANGLAKPEVFKAALAGLPSIFFIAIFFALSYRKTGSLWFPIGFHMAWDWLLGCVFSSPVSGIPTFHLFDVQETGTSFLSGGAFGAESSFFLIPLLLAMTYVMWLVPDHPRAVANLDRPETMDEFEQVPLYAPYSAPLSPASSTQHQEEGAPRENRYNARFGSGEGFDSGMLHELKQMHEERERAERERVEAERSARRVEEMRVEEIRRAQIEAQAEAQSQAQTVALAGAQQSETTPDSEETSVSALTSELNQAAPIASTGKSAPVAPVSPKVASPRTPVEAEEVAAPVAVVSGERPIAPVAPPPLPPVTKQPEPAPEAPKEPAPPKKARPRW